MAFDPDEYRKQVLRRGLSEASLKPTGPVAVAKPQPRSALWSNPLSTARPVLSGGNLVAGPPERNPLWRDQLSTAGPAMSGGNLVAGPSAEQPTANIPPRRPQPDVVSRIGSVLSNIGLLARGVSGASSARAAEITQPAATQAQMLAEQNEGLPEFANPSTPAALASAAPRVLGKNEQVGYLKPGVYGGDVARPITVTNEGPAQVVRGPAIYRDTNIYPEPTPAAEPVYGRLPGKYGGEGLVGVKENYAPAIAQARENAVRQTAAQERAAAQTTAAGIARPQDFGAEIKMRDLLRKEQNQSFEQNQAVLNQYLADAQRSPESLVPGAPEAGIPFMEQVNSIARQTGADPYAVQRRLRAELAADKTSFEEQNKGVMVFGNKYDYGEAINRLGSNVLQQLLNELLAQRPQR